MIALPSEIQIVRPLELLTSRICSICQSDGDVPRVKRGVVGRDEVGQETGKRSGFLRVLLRRKLLEQLMTELEF